MGGRWYSTVPKLEEEAGKELERPEYLDAKEEAVWDKLATELTPTELEVKDISGGCGTMYAIDIASQRFKGLGLVAQHRLVNQVLKEEVRGWHGVQLKTRVG